MLLLRAIRSKTIDISRRVNYDVACNWKVFVDNYLDGGYHVDVVHGDLTAGLDIDSYSITSMGKRNQYYFNIYTKIIFYFRWQLFNPARKRRWQRSPLVRWEHRGGLLPSLSKSNAQQIRAVAGYECRSPNR